jgi:hypothetical protein
MKSRLLLPLLLGWFVFICHPAYPQTIDFARDIAPILSSHCIRCHSHQDPNGDIILTHRDEMSNEDSWQQVLDAVSGEDPRMPKTGQPLEPQQIALLNEWIAAGALWPEGVVLEHDPTDWWSFRPLTAPRIPNIAPSGFPIRNPIDAFVAAEWQRRGLHGSPEADRRTLIRRVTFDLTGLPPTAEEMEAFLSDSDPFAYENLVDRLLDSPRYGERWARHWLDAVHYGDTHGYDKDKLRPHAWPYRDYVIRAFNEDKPYRQFVLEQLAGDHIEPNSRDGIEALGFLACGPFDFVGQIEVAEGTLEKQRVRNIDRDDMVATAMNTFVSMTAQCARCHDHKFDPIRQEDYYSLQSVFAAVDRADRAYDMDVDVARQRAALIDERRSSQQQIDELEKEFQAAGGEPLAAIDREIDSLRQQMTQQRPIEYGYHSAISSDPNETKWVQVDLGQSHHVTRIGLAAAYDDFGGIGAGFGFPLRFRIEASSDPAFLDDVSVLVSRESEDFPNPGTAIAWWDVDAPNARFIRVTATRLAHRTQDYIFALAELFALDAQGNHVARDVSVQAMDSIEAPPRWRASNLTDGKHPTVSEQEAEPKLDSLKKDRQALLISRLGQSRFDLLERLKVERQRIDDAVDRLPPQQKVYAAATHFTGTGSFQPTMGKPRPIRMLHRGMESQPGDEVEPATLNCIQGLSGKWDLDPHAVESRRRQALAEWVVDPRNALTWRSIVNRVWHHHFGKGIVESLNDFGRMGSLPTHPELLDWLALEFRDGKQSFKDLHRWIVTSSTYRQSSAHSEDQARIDAGNQYLWRMQRRRLEAEAIRDSVLHVAGKLRLEMGGPGFQVFGLIEDHSPHYLYDQYNPDEETTHRRAIYRFIVRSVPDPWMTTLDCADATLLTDRRSETLTALQALSLLNNRFMLRMSEHFAARVEKTSRDPDAQIDVAFRWALQRDPNDEERAALRALREKSGLSNVCRALFNSNEFVFVD